MEADLTGEERLAGALAQLAKVDAQGASAAGIALGRVMEGVRGSCWPDVAWRFSRLTDDGFPVEFAWSSRDEAIRWTAEVAGPEVPDAQRAEKAMLLFAALSGNAAPAADRAMQRPDSLRFGAWIGGRHRGRDSRYKLYFEGHCPASWQDDLSTHLARAIAWRMIGDSGEEREHYGRVTGLTAWGLASACRRFGLKVDALLGRGLDRGGDEPFGRTCGISIAERDGVPVAITLFPALVRWRSPAQAVTRFLAAAAAFGSSTAVLEALVTGGPEAGRLGLVGLGCAVDGSVWLQAGWRPGSARHRIGAIGGSEKGPFSPSPPGPTASASTRTA